MPTTAACHCGATRIDLPEAPAAANECNCTYCRRVGALWAYFEPEGLTIAAASDQVYSATGLNQHHFCGTCGMQTHGFSPDWGSVYNMGGTPKAGVEPGAVPEAKKAMVNIRMIDGLNLEGLKINRLDGLNSW